jgi:hypothetical protein
MPRKAKVPRTPSIFCDHKKKIPSRVSLPDDRPEWRRIFPYGCWFDFKSRREVLYDRDYQAIAIRNMDEPRNPERVTETFYFEHQESGWAYNDGNPPGRWAGRASVSTRNNCREIERRFFAGECVRDLLLTAERKKLIPGAERAGVRVQRVGEGQFPYRDLYGDLI